jgi:hypothetical protein
VIGTHPASWIFESHCGFFMPVQCAAPDTSMLGASVSIPDL